MCYESHIYGTNIAGKYQREVVLAGIRDPLGELDKPLYRIAFITEIPKPRKYLY